MNLVDRILREENIRASIKRVAANKGAPGVDGMTVDELQGYFDKHGADIKIQIREKRYTPQPVRRVYTPKPNSDKLRPLGIPSKKQSRIGIRIATVKGCSNAGGGSDGQVFGKRTCAYV